jgi:beta-lactamase regulating signal transducer with metallopeptidase domain
MMSALIEAALRSLLVGLVVMSGLRVFRVRNVLGQKAAWGLVLLAAFAMPLLSPITARWQVLPPSATLMLPVHPMTLLEELQARIQAKSTSDRKPAPSATSTPAANPPRSKDSPAQELSPSWGQHAKATSTDRLRAERVIVPTQKAAYVVSPTRETQRQGPPNRALSFSAWAFALYLGIAALLFFRIVLGLAVTLRLWRSSEAVPVHKVPYFATSVPVRSSVRVSSPITIGSGVLLPADYETWDTEKLCIVLAHERSHIRQGDFYLQLLAGLYAAVVWFSPLGWWLKRELADLAEAISDRAGMQAAQSRTSYAEVLLEFAAAPRPAAIGVAMARPGSLSRRIERLLNDHAFRQSFANGRRALVAVVLVPLAIFVATAMVRVEAAPAEQPSTRALASLPIKLAPTQIPEPEPADSAQQLASEDGEWGNLSVPAWPAVSSSSAALPEPEAQAALSDEIASVDPPGLSQLRIMGVARASAEGAEPSGAMSFDRTLSVTGEAQLTVSTGSGNIHLAHGSEGQIRIHGRIHVNRDASEEEARRIAANPPIEQDGNVIRVGQHEEHWHGISIDYEVEAPAGTLLEANSGSGDIVDEGVGQNAKLETGSGDIEARGLQGPFVVKTGSGNITAEQVGQGDVKAETGSGDIEVKGIHGSFRAQTGSGNIKATGTPSAAWTLETGSGDIELWAGSTPLTLDVSTGSGSLTTDREMLVQGSLDRHHIKGNLNGGGPTVRAQTGSGDIRLH